MSDKIVGEPAGSGVVFRKPPKHKCDLPKAARTSAARTSAARIEAPILPRPAGARR